MIKKIVRLFSSLVINNIKFMIIKLFHPIRFKFNIKSIISPMNTFDIQNKGQIKIGGNTNIPAKSFFGVRDNGILEIKDGSFINNNCQIIAHKRVSIGKNVCIGPNTVIIDHDHQFAKDGVKKKVFNSKEIIIEDGAWIGANCVLLKGTKIGKNSVIAAGSIVNFNVPDNTILVQKKEDSFIEIK